VIEVDDTTSLTKFISYLDALVEERSGVNHYWQPLENDGGPFIQVLGGPRLEMPTMEDACYVAFLVNNARVLQSHLSDLHKYEADERRVEKLARRKKATTEES